MPASVVSIGSGTRSKRHGSWSLFEVAQPGKAPVPYAILLADDSGGPPAIRARDLSCFDFLEEEQIDILEALPEDLEQKGREMGGARLIASLEDSLSNFFRIGDRTSIAWSGDAQATLDRLFDEHVDATVRRYISHLPLYALSAAATKFGEMMDIEDPGQADWIRVPGKLRLTAGMFVARVVGRSMEPKIPDGSLCIFRAPVTGSRLGRVLLIEKFDEADFASRYTVKRYARKGMRDESAERETGIRLEPLNPEFEAFELDSDKFRVVAEFVQVLYP
jgi:phage repressor protein C with HTH and peptisase S24 domain